MFERMNAVNANVELYEQQVIYIMQSMEAYKSNIEDMYIKLESQYSHALGELQEIND